MLATQDRRTKFSYLTPGIPAGWSITLFRNLIRNNAHDSSLLAPAWLRILLLSPAQPFGLSSQRSLCTWSIPEGILPLCTSVLFADLTMREAFPDGEIIEIEDDSDDPSLPSEDEAFLSLNEVEAAFNDDDNIDPDVFNHGHNPLALHGVLPNHRNFYQTCLNAVIEVFPDICHDHVQQLYDARLQDPEILQPPLLAPATEVVAQDIITGILDGGGKYPKEKDRINELKRKRSMKLNSDEEEAARWREAARDEARRAVTFRYSEEA